MTTRELNKLLDLVVKLREDLCARYTLMDGPGSCCYNDGGHPTEYYPKCENCYFSMGNFTNNYCVLSYVYEKIKQIKAGGD